MTPRGDTKRYEKIIFKFFQKWFRKSACFSPISVGVICILIFGLLLGFCEKEGDALEGAIESGISDIRHMDSAPALLRWAARTPYIENCPTFCAGSHFILEGGEASLQNRPAEKD